jgi:hypothetical protein
MDSVNDNLVTIARFANQEDLMIASALLQSAGIECVALNPFSVRFGQYVELQVYESDAEDARAMLKSESPLPETDGG